MTQGKAFPRGLKKNADETHDEFDLRCWKHRAHVVKGRVVIPGAAVHKALIAAAKFLNERIPGEGKKTWTKRFGAGVMVLENPKIEPKVTEKAMQGTEIHVPSDGRAGGSTRVWKTFPYFEEWEADLKVTVVDGLIDEATFERHMRTAGMYVGFGTFRPSSPQSPGTNGRFSVESLEWKEVK
jgi:hypothetical protein